MARFCAVCGDKLGFWSRGKMCPACRAAHAEMMAGGHDDRAQETAAFFRQRLPEIADVEIRERLEKDVIQILGAVTESSAPQEAPLMHTTLQRFQGFQIVEYKGVVVSKVIHDARNAKLMKNVLSRTQVSYEALDCEARKIGANAVVGIDVSVSGIFGMHTDNLGRIMETVTGTAVVVRPLGD